MECVDENPEERPSFEVLDTRLRGQEILTIEQPTEKKEEGASLSLADIFPPHIAEALQKGEKVEPEHHDMVTIFFSDIAGFTTISQSLSPLKVSKLLDRLYLSFDELSRKHGVFKGKRVVLN